MCGIFGLVVQNPDQFSQQKIKKIIDLLFLFSETRGKEASGIAISTKSKIQVFKKCARGKVFKNLPELKKTFSEIKNTPFCIMGHTRMFTNGNQFLSGNNQPVLKKSLVCIHNGIIVNAEQLWKENTQLKRNYEVDTEILFGFA